MRTSQPNSIIVINTIREIILDVRSVIKKTKKSFNLPRAPIMFKTGSVHKDKSKVLDRKRKHKGKDLDD